MTSVPPALSGVNSAGLVLGGPTATVTFTFPNAAGRTLLFDRAKLIELADTTGIAIQAFAPGQVAEPKQGSEGMNKE